MKTKLPSGIELEYYQTNEWAERHPWLDLMALTLVIAAFGIMAIGLAAF